MLYMPIQTVVKAKLTESTNVNIVVVKNDDGTFKPADATTGPFFFTCMLDEQDPSFPNQFNEYGTDVVITRMPIQITQVGCKDATVQVNDYLTIDIDNPGFLKKVTDPTTQPILAIALTAPVVENGVVTHEAIDIYVL